MNFEFAQMATIPQFSATIQQLQTGGQALAGSELEYVVGVTNTGSSDATNVVILDDLDDPTPNHLSYVPGSTTLNGVPASGLLIGTTLTVNFSTANGPLAPGESTLSVDLVSAAASALIR